MRIIAGKFRGRRLKPPRGKHVRPTTDRFRESIFNALTHRIGTFEGARVADLFAGTGALGLEVLSRGAAFVCFVEKHAGLLRENIALVGGNDQCRVLVANARALPEESSPYDIIFMDPPYQKGLIEPALESLAVAGWVGEQTLVVVERHRDEDVSFPSHYNEVRVLEQGNRRAHFLEYKSAR